MSIIRNLRKDFEEGRMDNLRSLKYEDSGTKAPYVLKSEGSSYNEISKRVDDLSRIAQMLIDKPGLKHLANEALLKQEDITQKLQSNEKYQQGTRVGNILRRAGGTLKHVAQVAGSTLAQVPVNGTGTHFLRAFRTDTYLQDGDPASGFAQFFGAGGVEGAQYALRGERVPVQGLITDSKLPNRNTTANPGDIGTYHVGIEGDLVTEDNNSTYTSDSTYTGTDTLTNVNNIKNSQSVPKLADLLRNTTPSPGSLGIDKKDVIGDVTENVFVAQGNYRADTPYTETNTVTNIINANNGNPINNPSGTGLFDQTFAVQTTPLEGTLGVTNKAIEGTITSLPKQFEQKFTDAEGARYLGSTENNSIAAQAGAPISNKNLYGNSPFETTSLKGNPVYGKSIENRGVLGDITELNPKLENKYRDGNTYTEFDTKGNIDSIQSGEVFFADGSIPLRDNSNFDRLNGSSPTIEQAKQDPDIYDGKSGNTSLESGKQIQDFRALDSENKFNGSTSNTYSFNYNDRLIKKETRVGLGDPGKITRNRTSYTVEDADTRDKVNYLDVSNTPLNGITENRDLIQLEFQILTPDQTYYLAFRAFLANFDDNYAGSWNSQRYLGRADNFYTYGGFERTINIGFKIAAQSREEMEPLYRKAATLASVTAPTYGEKGRFMRGSLAKVTVGDYIYEQPGIIESVQYTWQKEYPWEISFQNPEGEGGRDQILPHVLDVSLSFKVIHDFLPQTGVNPFITNYKPVQENKKTYIPLVTT